MQRLRTDGTPDGSLAIGSASADGALGRRTFRQLDRLVHTLGVDGPVSVAVSGGSDSVAALHLTHRWAKAAGREVTALTIDHGLRAGSADEAAGVAARCAAMGVPHRTLKWTDDRPGPGDGNLQQSARLARHRLLAQAMGAIGSRLLVTGHTRDDQWETFLLRTRQGSGWFGLGGIDPVSVSPAWPEGRGLFVLRPLLTARRAALRTWLAAEGLDWVDDPSNADAAFERVRMRQQIAAGSPALAARLASVHGALHGLRQAERQAMARHLEADVRAGEDGRLHWTLKGQRNGVSVERAGRILSLLIQLAAGRATPPDGQGVRACLVAIGAGGEHRGRTLGGAVIGWAGDTVSLSRDRGLAAPAPCAHAYGCTGSAIWDNRFERISASGARRCGVDRQIGADRAPRWPLPILPAATEDGQTVWRPLAVARLQALIASMKSCNIL